jgi:hypothetical protein
MKKFNGSIFTLFAMLLNTATTNAWEWPSWLRRNTQNQDRTWEEYGKQQGKAFLLGIKNRPKTTGTVVAIGIGGLALAYKYQKQLRTLWIGSYRLYQKKIIADILAEIWAFNQKEQWSDEDEQRFGALINKLLDTYQNIKQ